MGRKVFYSWQSDRPNATNRGLILTALRAACAELGEDPTIDERPEVDHDTQGVPGAPDIVQTIFAKIDGAHVFVADVSIITTDAESRACPNPNVLIELGYAIKTLGWNQIILVMNTAFGDPELLPFDLKTKRVTTYRMAEEDSERAPERKKLQSILQAGLKIIFEHSSAPMPGTAIEPALPGDLARKAVEEAKPNAPSAVRRFMQWFGDQLDVLAPDKAVTPPDEGFVQALDRTVPLLSDFARLAEVIAAHDARVAGATLMKGFEYVLERYDVKPDVAATFQDTDFDLAKFVGHEAMVMLVACLIREARWSMLGEILSEEIILRGARSVRTRRFDDVSASIKLLVQRNDRLKLNRRSIRADLLQNRHAEGELSTLVSFAEFLDAEFFLFLRGELEEGREETWGARWAPWSAVYLEHAAPPRYLLEAKRKAVAQDLATGLGVGGVDELRDRLTALKPQVPKVLNQGNPFWEGPLRDFDASAIGTR